MQDFMASEIGKSRSLLDDDIAKVIYFKSDFLFDFC